MGGRLKAVAYVIFSRLARAETFTKGLSVSACFGLLGCLRVCLSFCKRRVSLGGRGNGGGDANGGEGRGGGLVYTIFALRVLESRVDLQVVYCMGWEMEIGAERIC